MERHEAFVVDYNAGHELSFLAAFTLEQQALRAPGGVEQQLFQVPQIIGRRVDRRSLVSCRCKSHKTTVALKEIPLHAVAALPVLPPQLHVAEVAAAL